MELTELQKHGEYLEKVLRLPTSPLAVKMLETETDIPQGAIRPKRDRGYHLAQCQTFGLSRRDKDVIAMLKEDNWCPGPLMTYGLVKMDDRPGSPPRNFDSFEYGKYIGILTGPLATTNYVPDLVLIYSNPVQLRSMLWSMRESEQPFVDTGLFSWSCYNSIVKPMLSGNCFVVLPDPGEYERALGTADEMMFSIPLARFGTFMEDFVKAQDGHFAHANITPAIRPDFPLPDIYRESFKRWGLDTD
ncbi:MAG: DUF169 domain-containing protein [Dehalococcoidales bacterium]|nr:DUF169 domain-containing protein [Dehalococcoidales bacterium]